MTSTMACRLALDISRTAVRLTSWMPHASSYSKSNYLSNRFTKAPCFLACQQCYTASSEHWRLYSSEVLEVPPVASEDKKYAPKIEKLVEEIGQLTLMEVADLNELLKKTLKITDAPVMSMGAAMPVAVAQEEEDEATSKPEKVAFTVKLTHFEASKKVTLIKEVKSLMEGMNLVQAKKLVESLPQTIRIDISKDEADSMKESLEKAGGTVEIE